MYQLTWANNRQLGNLASPGRPSGGGSTEVGRYWIHARQSARPGAWRPSSANTRPTRQSGSAWAAWPDGTTFGGCGRRGL